MFFRCAALHHIGPALPPYFDAAPQTSGGLHPRESIALISLRNLSSHLSYPEVPLQGCLARHAERSLLAMAIVEYAIEISLAINISK